MIPENLIHDSIDTEEICFMRRSIAANLGSIARSPLVLHCDTSFELEYLISNVKQDHAGALIETLAD